MYSFWKLVTPVTLCILAICGYSNDASAILVEDFVQIRHLDVPAQHPPEEYLTTCGDQIQDFPNQKCGAGPAIPYGIDNAGNVFGTIQTNFPHLHHNEDAIRWLRATGYEAENIGKGGPFGSATASGIQVTGEGDHGGPSSGSLGILFDRGGDGRGKVTSEGFVWGTWNINRSNVYQYNFTTNEFIGLGAQISTKGNNFGKTPSGPSGSDVDRFSKIRDINAVTEEEPEGFVQNLPVGVFGYAINDADVVVGYQDPSCMVLWEGHSGFCFGKQKPAKVEPTGDNEWGEPTLLETLVEGSEDTPNAVYDISNSTPAFGVGRSSAETGANGVVWDISSGKIIADLGGFVSFPMHINSAGTMIVATKGFFPQEPTLWWTDNEWQDFTELPLNDLLDAEVPGSEQWSSLSCIGSGCPVRPIDVESVNDSGQIVGRGVLADGVTVSTYLLDTKLLSQVLLGDVNNDGSVNNLDITPFITALSVDGDEETFLSQVTNGSFLAADIDKSGAPNNLDITQFINLLASQTATAVPEPASVFALLTAGALVWRRRNH